MDMSFGACLKRVRIKNKLTLRQASAMAGWDCGNWSKMERGMLPPPSTKHLLEEALKPFDLSLFDRDVLLIAAYNFHIGKLQERWK